MSAKTSSLVPVTPPGITILENIAALGLTQVEMAARMGRPVKTINEIIKGKATITPETALQLERVIGIPASFWLAREARYREYLAKKAERRILGQAREWLGQFPTTVMRKFGWLGLEEQDVAAQTESLLGFLGVAQTSLWGRVLEPYASYRKSPTCESDPGALACWLRKGEIEAAKIQCGEFERGAFLKCLEDIRRLTLKTPEVFVPRVRELCASAGVSVVYVRELPGTRAHGVARWLSPDKAMIQLSSRFKSDDQIWFSFFHEAGHILLDAKREAFLECDGNEDDREGRANAFAAEFLIPPREYASFVEDYRWLRRGFHEFVTEFAAGIGIAPGIVVGRLQHDDVIKPSYLNKLKRFYTWPEEAIF